MERIGWQKSAINQEISDLLPSSCEGEVITRGRGIYEAACLSF